MGRKKLPPGEKKSHAKSQAEQRDKLKKEVGEEEFNNAEAERKRTSRQRVWESIHQHEKDQRNALARIRGQRFRAKKKAEKEALQPGPQPAPHPAPQRTQPGPQPAPHPAPQPGPQPAPHPAPQRTQPGPQPAPHPAPQRTQPGPQPAPHPAPQPGPQPAPHPAPQRTQPGPEMATPRRRRTNRLQVVLFRPNQPVARTPRKSRLYYHLRLEKQRVAELQAEIGKLNAAAAEPAATEPAVLPPKSAHKSAARDDRTPRVAVCTAPPRVDRIPRVEDDGVEDIPPHRVDRSHEVGDHGDGPRDDTGTRSIEDAEEIPLPPPQVDQSPQVENGGDVTLKKAELYDTVVDNLRRMSRTERLRVLKSVTSPEELKVKRLTSQLAKDVKVDRRSLLSGPRKVSTRAVEFRGRRELVIEFLKRPEHSYTLPGKKDTVTVKKVKHQKVILTEFTDHLHKIYNEQHPSHTVSRTFFNDVRRVEKYIKVVKFNNTSVCLCVKHQNFALNLRAVGVKILPDDLVRNTTVDVFTATLLGKNLPDTIRCETWQRVRVPYGDPEEGKTCWKLRLVESDTPRDSYIDNLAQEFLTIKDHTTRAQNQHRVVRQLRERMSPAECTIQMDFAENWMVSYPEEPQSVYYAKEPVTLHPAVIHHREEEVTTHWSLALVTDDRAHDTGAILAFLRVLCDFVSTTLPKVTTIHYASDSPSSQYRNISIFSILCKHQQLFGLQATWTYFEAGHGKGPCDGVGAAAKRNADLAVKRNKKIRNAAQFAERGNKLEGSVRYICVAVPDIVRERRRVRELVASKSVPGTMSVHGVVPVTPDHSIAVRDISCFDACCWENCTSLRQCPGWKERVLFPGGDQVEKAEVEPAPEPEATEQSAEPAAPEPEASDRPVEPTPQEETYDVEDFLACIYDGQWYLGKVIERGEESGEYVVDFMVHKSRGDNTMFRWPVIKDILTIPKEDILLKTCSPAVVGTSRRISHYVLPPALLQLIAARFAAL